MPRVGVTGCAPEFSVTIGGWVHYATRPTRKDAEKLARIIRNDLRNQQQAHIRKQRVKS